jgi:aromatic ring-opening dioxygenase LigB subunit
VPSPLSGLIFAAIAPHGSLAIPELCPEPERALAGATRTALRELGRRFEASALDATVVLTPHNVKIEDSLAVVVAGKLEGLLEEEGGRVELTVAVDCDLADAAVDELRLSGIPTAAVSFGVSDRAEAAMPMDWGTLIPLWFLGRDRVPVVLVCPSADRSAEEHVRAGAALARAAGQSGKRVALIASADNGHAHTPQGPYGYHPAAAEYDRRVVDAVRAGHLGDLVELADDFVRAARADSYRQLLMLHGALGDAFEAELLSYEAPTYYGMLCAAFVPAG